MEIATGDLFFIADLAAEVVDDEAPDRFAALSRRLLAFLRRRPSYLQIQFIDATGQEIFRIERTSGAPQITPGSELQDESDRSYFSSTLRIESGKVFASTTEPKLEPGALEQESQQSVRLATPIDDSAAGRQGVVVLAVHGGYLLRAFEQNTHEIGIQHMVVSSDGYWIRDRSEAERGFAVERGRSFQNSFPEVWEQMLASPQGRIESSEGVFYFDTVAQDPLTLNPGTAGPPVWVFISLVPTRLFDNIAVRAATPLVVLGVPIYFVIFVAGCLLASALQRRKLAEEALRSLEGVKSAIMTASLDGIVVMDEAGVTLEFNPSAQRIFGYTLEEARGRLVADLIIPPAYRERHRKGLDHYLATGEGRIVDKHVGELTGIRKSGEEFPVELTVCPVMLAGERFFYGFLRDLSESGRRRVEADPLGASS
jgi:PAS domain S-box-containing protein